MTQSEQLIKDIWFSKFKVDVYSFAEFERKFMAKFYHKVEELAKLGIVKFNSTKCVAEWMITISNGNIDVSRGTGKVVYTKPEYQQAYPQLKLFAEVKRMESVRRHIKTAKGNFENGTFDVSEITATEGRIYQKNIYSVPYEVRQFLEPFTKEEGRFFYFDLSSAELALNAYHYKDEKLLKDIQDGVFWDKWLEATNSDKDTLKKCIYAISYSVSDVGFPANAPKEFFKDFANAYPTFVEGLKRTKYCWETNPSLFNGRYYNVVTKAAIPLPNPKEYHSLFKVLNYRIQQSLSSYMQILCNSLCKDNPKVTPYVLNFDSFLFTNPDWDYKQVSPKIKEIREKLIADGSLPCPIPFKTSTGSNFAVAQGWTGNDETEL